MPWFIKSAEEGRFVGEFLGLGFFETDRGEDCSPEEEPIQFSSQEEAQTYLDSWNGGKQDCIVVEENCANCIHPPGPEPLCWDCYGENYGHVTEIVSNAWCRNWKKI